MAVLLPWRRQLSLPAFCVCLASSGSLSPNIGDSMAPTAWSPVAWTDCGPVAGTVDAAMGAFVYRGVPFAMPPLGERRWKRSELLKEGGGCWNGVFDARAPAPVCAQNPSMQNGTVTWDGVEDCLTVDVWSWMNNRSGLRPVLVDIHGGSLLYGDTDKFLGFQEEQFVIVSVRYRLHVLGFLALSELSIHDPAGVSGNYGFSDQVTSLKWVQRNARAFGGNPGRVTIIGCSSGGTSVWNLLVAPAARGLFHAAIPLSSASHNNVTLAQAEHDNRIFAERACGNSTDRYQCLMHLPMESVMEGCFYMMYSFPFFSHPDFELPSPTEYNSGICIVDGVVIPSPLHVALRTPELHAHVPVLAGSCSQEGDTGLLPDNASSHDFACLVSKFVASLKTAEWPESAAKRIAELYPPMSREFGGRPKVAMDAMIADIRVVCGTHFNAHRLVEGRAAGISPSAADVWIYYSDLNATSTHRVNHCYTQDTLAAARSDGCASPPCAEVDKAYYANMLRVHSEFIKSGKPPAGSMQRLGNTTGFEDGNYMLNTLGGRITASRSRLKDRCDFWRSTRVLEQYAWDELSQVLNDLAVVV